MKQVFTEGERHLGETFSLSVVQYMGETRTNANTNNKQQRGLVRVLIVHGRIKGFAIRFLTATLYIQNVNVAHEQQQQQRDYYPVCPVARHNLEASRSIALPFPSVPFLPLQCISTHEEETLTAPEKSLGVN